MAYRKDLERNAAAMMKIKNPQFKLEKKAQKLIERADKRGYNIDFKSAQEDDAVDLNNPSGVFTINKPSGKKTQIFFNKDEYNYGTPDNPTGSGDSFLGIQKSNRKGEWKKGKVDYDSYR